MRANAALQVLGFLLNLARGSEVGNSQAGKRRGITGRLGTWDPEPSARNPGGQELGRGEVGVPTRVRWDHLGRNRQVGFSARSGRGRDS